MKELNTFKKFLNEDVEEKKLVSENVNSDDLKELFGQKKIKDELFNFGYEINIETKNVQDVRNYKL